MADGNALALALGAVVAAGASWLVLKPLVLGEAAIDRALAPIADDPSIIRPPDPASAVEALREIEFDRATGKLSDGDYQALKATYTREALAELRARDGALAAAGVGAAGGAGGAGDDAVERALQAYRARAPRCPEHGPRAQADARFCTECGRYLLGRCPRCGAACEREGQRFCTDCGTVLAAVPG